LNNTYFILTCNITAEVLKTTIPTKHGAVVCNLSVCWTCRFVVSPSRWSLTDILHCSPLSEPSSRPSTVGLQSHSACVVLKYQNIICDQVVLIGSLYVYNLTRHTKISNQNMDTANWNHTHPHRYLDHQNQIANYFNIKVPRYLYMVKYIADS